MQKAAKKPKSKPRAKVKKKQPLGPWQDAWVKSLETGGWTQGDAFLCRRTGGDWKMCCLGVACEVAVQNGEEIQIQVQVNNQLSMESTVYSYDKGSSALPGSMIKLMGFFGPEGKIEYDRARSPAERAKAKRFGFLSLAEANDRGAPFQKIAEFVRKYPHMIFSSPK